MPTDRRLSRIAAALAMAVACTGAARAEMQISLYGGAQVAADSRVSGNDPALGSFDFNLGWKGNPLDPPPYWGIRLTRWRDDGWGLALELNHAKVYGDAATFGAAGFSRLEFTDGLNLLTVNAMRRFAGSGRIVPYAGLGLGLSVPHAEVTTPTGETRGYQVTGPAAVWIAGASLPLRGDRFSVFAEYKGSRTWNSVDLEGGGRLDADITTHALNIGLSFRF